MAVAEGTSGLPLAFPCTVPGCLKVFPTRAALARHGQGHNGVRGHQCTLCDSKFRCASHLKRHMRNHTNTRPYACNACPKAYADHNNLIYHQVVHHNALPYTCGWPACSAAYPQERRLREHIASVHGVVALRANGRAKFTFSAEQEPPVTLGTGTGPSPGPSPNDEGTQTPSCAAADGVTSTPGTPGTIPSGVTTNRSAPALMRASVVGPYAINTSVVLPPGQLPESPAAPHPQLIAALVASDSGHRAGVDTDTAGDSAGDSARHSTAAGCSQAHQTSSGQAVAPPRRSELPDSEAPTRRKRRLPDTSNPAPHRMPAPGIDSYGMDLDHGRSPGPGQAAEDDGDTYHHGQSGASGDAGTRYLAARSVKSSGGEPQSRALVAVPTLSSTGSHAHAPLPRPASRSRWIVPRAATSPPAAFASEGQVLPSHGSCPFSCQSLSSA